MIKYLLSMALLTGFIGAEAADFRSRTAAGLEASPADVHIDRTANVNPVRRANSLEHEWESVGQCVFTDDILSGPYSSLPAYTVAVEVEADKKNPGFYRIVDLYGANNPYAEAFTDIKMADEALRYICINATDPDNVIIEPSPLGLVYTGNNEEYFVASQSWYETTGEVSSSFIDSYGYRGKMVNNIITFGTNALWISTPTLDKTGNGWNTNRNGGFRLVLPGGTDYTTAIGTNSWCPDDYGRVVVAVMAGDDVASARLQVTRVGAPDPTDADFAQAQSLQPNQGFYFTLLQDSKPNERYTLFARSYDADGAKVGEAKHYVYASDNTQWIKLGAKAVFTDNIVSNVYSDINLGEYELDVEVDPSTPGRYRLVNPYATAPYNVSTADIHGVHPHYIYLDCTDPDCVVLEEAPLGMLTTNDGAMRVTSDAAMMLAEGKTKEDIKAERAGGVMKFNIITFPVTAGIYVGFNTEGTKLWLANYEEDSYGNHIAGSLKIDLRDAIAASVSSVEADDNSAPEYFSLQGIRVSHPAQDGFYIVKRGNNVTKIYNR
ncbi:MAG: hypothetical protein K2M19_00625 [Muribaculaceae bacterium]|nr:hypothetical protein [Muribaculaceae bacterium]